jgi:hypothetical protein
VLLNCAKKTYEVVSGAKSDSEIDKMPYMDDELRVMAKKAYRGNVNEDSKYYLKLYTSVCK